MTDVVSRMQNSAGMLSCGKDDVVGKAIGSSDSETLGLILEGKRKVKTNVWLAHCCVR